MSAHTFHAMLNRLVRGGDGVSPSCEFENPTSIPFVPGAGTGNQGPAGDTVAGDTTVPRARLRPTRVTGPGRVHQLVHASQETGWPVQPMTAPQGASPPLTVGGIVVGVDGSPGSLTALRWAAAEASARGTALHTVIAWEFPQESTFGDMCTAGDFHPVMAAEEVLATALADADIVPNGESVTATPREGHPAEVLLATAEGADLLVVGTRGHGKIVGTLLGSVSHYVTAHAPCPVTVITPTPSAPGPYPLQRPPLHPDVRSRRRVSVSVQGRVEEFCRRFGLRVPILQAPMAGACPPALAIAVASAGGMGGAGAVNDSPDRIAEWARQFRAGSDGPFQLNLWIPDPPTDDPPREAAAREFLTHFGSPGKPGGPGPEFAAQCDAVLAAAPAAASSIMGLLDPEYVTRLRERGIAWFACATTLEEALAAESAGADVIVAQGMEAGGHRGTFDPDTAEHTGVELRTLLLQLAGRITVPIVAAGGIGDGRAMAAALALGASAVQVGTALLRCPETAISPVWSAALEGLAPGATVTTRAYTGRLGRSVPTEYVRAWRAPDAPPPAPYPTQRRLVTQMAPRPTRRPGPRQLLGRAERRARPPRAGRPGRRDDVAARVARAGHGIDHPSQGERPRSPRPRDHDTTIEDQQAAREGNGRRGDADAATTRTRLPQATLPQGGPRETLSAAAPREFDAQRVRRQSDAQRVRRSARSI